MTEIADRLTVVESVYHQRAGRDPIAIHHRWDRTLSDSEQSYSRELNITEQWQPLDCGWITTAGMLIIANEEGQFLQTIPTDEDRQAAMKRIVELRCGDSPPWLVLPQECFRGQPSDVSSIQLRCQHDSARCTVHLIPA